MPPCTHPPEATRVLFAARDYVTGEPFSVAECERCRLTVTQPQPGPDALPRFYPQGYYGTAGTHRFPRIVEWVQGRLYARRARAIERLSGGPGRVLDVGCGRGRLLLAFRERGWSVEGTELSDASAAHPRDQGIRVHVGPLESGPWRPGSFDAVTMWHVLEHWPDPSVPLAEAARLLRPGGVLAVGVPNYASPEARLTRAGWFHLDVPRHLTHLTTAALDRVLKTAGFDVRRVSHLAPEYDLFSFVQSAQNWAGLPPNLLYRVLRRDGAKLGRRPSSAAAVVASAVIAVPLAIAAVPCTLTLSILGLGSSVMALAVKVE